ncbi:hypothetical protein [Kitasatospora sp. NPDC101183]|uniref:hypothetical protein n=1 Tax=Kitasatospora sp. NPDC101183 TaxID=3364100 RepID=UPI0037F6292C
MQLVLTTEASIEYPCTFPGKTDSGIGSVGTPAPAVALNGVASTGDAVDVGAADTVGAGGAAAGRDGSGCTSTYADTPAATSRAATAGTAIRRHERPRPGSVPDSGPASPLAELGS